MTSQDLQEGVELTLAVAHDLRSALGRTPRACEIRWRVATRLQDRWTSLVRRDAVRMADQLMEVVATAAHNTT